MAVINDIFEGLIEPDLGNFSAELAQYVIGLRFSEEQIERYKVLAERVGEGALTASEQSELQAFVQADAFLSILKAKARRSLLKHSTAA